MASDFKSHVLRRDEKGVFGVPFKRWLLAGVGGGLVYMVTSFAFRGWGIPIGMVAVILTIVFTAPRGGIPLWLRLIYRLRGSLLLIALRHPGSVWARLSDLLELPVEVVHLDGDLLFAPPHRTELDLREWITFATATDDDGLIFVDSPLEGD